MNAPQLRQKTHKSAQAQKKPFTARDFNGMAGRHEAENLASSFTGLVAFVAKGAKHYAIMSSDPQYTPEQQKHFRGVSQQYRRVANDTMKSIEECVGRPVFENPYVADRLNRPERAQLLADFHNQPQSVTRSIARDLQQADARLEEMATIAIPNAQAFQASAPSLQDTTSASVGGLAARIGSFLRGR